MQQKNPSQMIVSIGLGQQQPVPQNQGSLHTNQGTLSSGQPGIPQTGLPSGQGSMPHQIIPNTQPAGIPPNPETHLSLGQMQSHYKLIQAPQEKEEPTAELISFD